MGALNKGERDILLNSGFLKVEVQAFDDAKTPDGETQMVAFNSTTWKNMIYSRKEYITRCHEAGLENKQIRDLLVKHYASSKDRSPWDFLKLEYQPTDRNLTDTEFADKLQIRTSIDRHLVRSTKIAYGPIMASEFRPRRVRKSTVPQPTHAPPRPLMPVHKPATKPAPAKKRRFRI